MTENIYDRLQKKFDSLPMGFPKTESGVEMDILRSLYDEADAEMALALSMYPRIARDIAEKTGKDPLDTVEHLESMVKKGLAFKRKSGDEAKYSIIPFLPGIWEFQIKNLTPKFNRNMEKYYADSLGLEVFGSEPAYFKVIPHQKNISAQLEVFNYDQVANIVNEADKIAVFDCICRLDRKMQGEGCDRPIDVCIAFGANADHFMEMGVAREIDKDEALQVLDRSEKAGLVHCSTNTASGHFSICNCCSCCCVILRAITQLNSPSAVAKSSFYAESDADLCTGCGICLERCQISAITIDGDTALITEAKCIGCGLCVSTCPTEAMVMKRKPDEEIEEPLKKPSRLLAAIAEEKGKQLS